MKTLRIWLHGALVALIVGAAIAVIAQQPVVFPSPQAVTESGTWTVQPGNTANTTAWKVDGSAVTQPVSGTFWQATQPVSGTFWQATQPVSGTFWQTTQPVSTADGSQVTLGAKADAKSTATDTTAITVMQVLKEISAMEQAPASRAVTNAGTFATQSAITAASGSIASGAVASGAVASGAYAAGAMAAQSYAVGAIPPAAGTLVSGAITSAMTGTTSTVLVAAAASNYLYITSCSFSNTHASVTTMMLLQDGSGGTTLWEGINAFGGGSNVTFPVPLKVPTVGNGLYVQNVTTGSNTFASCSGFKSTVSY